MKKIFGSIFLLLCFILLVNGCAKIHNKEVLQAIQKEIPNDNFYFIRGLERDRSLDTNIRYRGIVYSDKLKEAKSFMGIQVALEDMESLWIYEDGFKQQYENALASTKAVKIMRGNAKKVFGDDIIVYIDFSNSFFLKEGVDFVEENIGRFVPDVKFGPPMYIDVFVDDITKVNIDEYKKKLFNLHQTLYKEYNIDSNINMDLQDRKYLTYGIAKNKIFYIFKDEPKIKELLKKYKRNGKLPPNEMGYLMDYFASYFYNPNIPSIRFEMYYEYMKNYKEINVIFFEGDEK